MGMDEAGGPKGSGAKVFITGNQVCMKRGLDTGLFKRYFIANGCSIEESPKEAQIIVAVTCAFISSYVDSALSMLAKLSEYPARLIVLGCLPAMAEKRFRKAFNGEYLITRDFANIGTLFPSFNIPLSALRDANTPDINVMKPFSATDFCPIPVRNSISEGKTPGPFLRIGEGCNNACTYCSHPRALGRLKSKPLEICLKEYRNLLRQNVSDLTIHANDPGAYGIDIKSTYPELLQHLHAVENRSRVKWNLCDINPKWLVTYRKKILDICTWGKVSSIGIPLQSGSPRILRRMNRFSHIEKVLDSLEEIKEADPTIKFSTHLIAGFPGETETDILLTLKIFKRVWFDSVYVFPFSPNPGTSAEKMQDKLTSQKIQLHKDILLKALTQMGLKVDVFT